MTDLARGERLKEERLRLHLSQEELATLVNSSRRAQVRYESGMPPGADYLAAVAAIGFDVLYIITGQRQLQPAAKKEEPAQDEHDGGITRREAMMLALFRSLSEAEKGEIQAAAESKKRMRELEQQLAEVTAAMREMGKRAA